MINKIIVLLVSAVFCASNSDALTIGPAHLETRLPPGETAEMYYYAQNETDAPVNVTVEPENWATDAYEYGKLKITDWVTLDCYKFDLKPKEIKKLKTIVRVPKDAKGELVAQIFFTSSGTDAAAGSVRSRIGAVLYVAIKGTETAKAEIRRLDISDMPGNGKIKIDVTIYNNGNVHIKPSKGHVLIEDLKGQRIALIDIVTESGVLPGRDRIFPVVADRSLLKEGEYRISSEIKYGKMYGEEKTAGMKKTLEVGRDGKVTVR